MIKKFEKGFGRKEAFVLFFILWTVPYFGLGYLNDLREVSLLPLWIDDFVPFWAPSIIGYALYFPMCFFTFLVIKDENILRNGVKAYAYVVLMAVLFFVLYPTAMPRPELTGGGFFEFIVGKMWEIDTTANAFPSQHVSCSFLSAFLYGRYFKGKLWIFILIAVVISVSTMFVKQHYVWDVISGFLLAILAYYLAFKEVKV